MKKLSQLVWTKKRKEFFLASVILTKDEITVFDYLIEGIPYKTIAEKAIMDIGKVNDLNKILKAKYRVAQLEYPDVFEPLPEQNCTENDSSIKQKTKDKYIERLESNWNNLEKWLNDEIAEQESMFKQREIIFSYKNVLEKMQELKKEE